MPTKILHFISSIRRGGKERQLAIIVSNTNQEIYPTKIIYLNEAHENYIEEYLLSNKCIKVSSRGIIGRISETYQIIKKEQPKIIFTWGIIDSVITLLLTPFLSFKFINGSVRHGIRSKKLYHYLRSFVLHLSNHIVSNSNAGLKVNNLDRGHILYNAISERFFNIKINSLEVIKLSEELQKPIFISVANLVPYKDYFTVLQAFAYLKKVGYSFSYLIIGSGPLKNEIYAKINDLGLIENVVLLGSKNNVEEYLAISDVFIHSSKGEGCSNAILEACAAGLPIIATCVGGTSEIVDETHGILFKYKNCEELIGAIKFLTSNPKLRIEMGKNSKTKAIGTYSISAMMKKYYQVVDEVLNHN